MMNTQLKIQLSRRLQSKAHEKALLMTPQGGAAITTQCFELPIEEEGKKISQLWSKLFGKKQNHEKSIISYGKSTGWCSVKLTVRIMTVGDENMKIWLDSRQTDIFWISNSIWKIESKVVRNHGKKVHTSKYLNFPFSFTTLQYSE